MASIDELLRYAKLSNSNKRGKNSVKRSLELGIGDHSSKCAAGAVLNPWNLVQSDPRYRKSEEQGDKWGRERSQERERASDPRPAEGPLEAALAAQTTDEWGGGKRATTEAQKRKCHSRL